MAKYTFRCEACDKTQQIYVGSSTFEATCSCGQRMIRQMPSISKPTVYEDPDKQSGCKWIENHEEDLKARKEHHYWTVLVPRFVDSGTYSVETMLQNGWISLTDDLKIVVNTKPPSQR